MIITIKNLTTNQISTDVGVLGPGETKSASMTPEMAWASADGLKTLQDAGRIQVSVTDEPTRLDSMDGAAATATAANMAFYVSSTGADTNPGTIEAPFKTIQKAIESIPKKIRHQIDVNIGSGNFTGFTITGFATDPMATVPVGIRVTGTMVTATIATGSTSGTFTAVTPGVAATADHAIVTDGAQTWTVNNLANKFIEILTGTSAGTILPITSNTATAITVPFTGTFGSIGGTYAIRECGTIINTAILTPNSIPAPGAAAGAAVGLGCNISNNVFTSNIAPVQLRFDFLKFAPPSTGAGFCLNNRGTSMTMTRCHFGDGASSAASLISLTGPLNISIQQSVLECTAGSGAAVGLNGFACQASISSCNFTGGTVSTGVSVGAGASVGCAFSATGCAFSMGSPISIEKGCDITLTGSRITATNSRCILVRPNTAIGGNNVGCFIAATGLFLANGSAGIELQGLHVCKIATLLGSGHTTAILLQRGARAEIGPASTITGTTEVSLDGVATDLATMRAASPKLITNTYGTIIFE